VAGSELQVVDALDVAFRPIRSGNAFEECVERLLSAMKLGLVQPGQRLPPERELAARLGVSRVTLRDALHSLGQAGWLEARRGRHGGTFVLERATTEAERRSFRRAAGAVADRLEDALVLRRVLELGAVEAAATPPVRADAADRLLPLLAECRAAGPDRYRAVDSRLHLAITELAGSPSLSAAAADVRMRMNNLLDAIPLLERNIAHSNDQHERIVRAILAGRPADARTAMDEHLAGTAALLRAFLT
jgi:DNA-binding FadR family transcriptional regulator